MITLNQIGQTPTASFDEPLEMLVTCHDKIREFCNQLEKLPSYIEQHGINDAVKNTITQAVHYFDQAGPAHHEDEEAQIFPILLERLPADAPKIEQLTGEHSYLHARWNAIRDDLLAIREGDIYAISRIDIVDFIRQYRQHAENEEAWMIPTAERVLTAEEKQKAGRLMAQRRHDQV